MVKIFRSFRKRLLQESKFRKYIMYAIGEILLVMIGILLALQVNNWNSNRKAKNTLRSALETVTSDLKRDTITASKLIEVFENNQETFKLIIDKKITKENYKDYPMFYSLVTLYQPFNIQTKGYDILKNISNQKTSERDSIFDDLTQFYSLLGPNLKKSNERLEKVVLDNLADFQEFPWFVDWTQGKLTDEMLTYFTTSEDYRKRVAAYNVLAYGNHFGLIRLYKENAKKVLKALGERLDDD
ncbi:MAG: DUF6090 family protein [Bacteroidota bacterium]